MTFQEFIAAWRDGSLEKDAKWRGYDFISIVPSKHGRSEPTRYTARALWELGFRDMGEMALPHCMYEYDLTDEEETKLMLRAWWFYVHGNSGHLRVLGSRTSASE